MSNNDQRLRDVWKQREVPVVLRRGGPDEKLRIRLPAGEEKFDWISSGRQHQPERFDDPHYWELGKTRFNDFVEQALDRFGKLYVIQPYREQEKCARACRHAKGHDCNCSCMGAHHGTGDGLGGWFDIGDAFSTRWGDRAVACRLMIRRPGVERTKQ
ncbi:hypothetical protein [Aureimonas psammosilenae]|uniref:hypothetical protein n=1 Tax=Aureimonas psammosilenae TaxID=2495496 RepID=UPI0012611300|nr:hypothetical protein [Aureimonas psammosilenae]